MRRSRIIAALVAVLYAAGLLAAWFASGVWQDRASERLLRSGRVVFADHIEEELHSVQWYQAGLAFEALGGWTNASPRSVAEMSAIAGRLFIDEINIVSSNGIVIASNVPKVLGDDWRRRPETAALLEILSPALPYARMMQPRAAQPFRHGTANPEFYCSYLAEAFLDRSGILELGFSMERLVECMAYSDGKNIREWEFGREGHFAVIDLDGDSAPDPLPDGAEGAALERGVVERIVEDGEGAYRLSFAYAGHLFAAIVPACEFGGQRRFAFRVFALTSGALILVFWLVIAAFVRAQRRLAALRRDADARAADDLAVARTIQLSSLPRAETFAPDELAFEFAAAAHPAREVGGDFYDFFWTSERLLAFVIGDVSGKGVPAALFMNEAKHAFPEALRREGSLAGAVAAMNDALCAHNDAEMFVTAWLGVLDTGTGEIAYVNAGHNRPYVVAADGSVERLDERGGRFLGAFPEAAYRATRRFLKPGDRLFLYTDGVTEAMDAASRQYGERRLAKLLATNPPDLVRAVEEDVAAHVAGAEASDDLTALVLAWNGLPAVRERTFSVCGETSAEVLAFLQEAVRLDDRRAKLRLLNAADELAANVVMHSGAKTLTVSVAHAAGRCRVVLVDDGALYNPLAHRDPDTHRPLEDRPLGGLGILMTKRLVSSVLWSHTDGFNRTTLVQRG